MTDEGPAAQRVSPLIAAVVLVFFVVAWGLFFGAILAPVFLD